MIIFIPVIIICMNNSCEFMQSTTYYHNEAECRASLDIQKQYMRNIVEQAGSSKIEHLESTCVDVNVKTRTRTEVDA